MEPAAAVVGGDGSRGVPRTESFEYNGCRIMAQGYKCSRGGFERLSKWWT